VGDAVDVAARGPLIAQVREKEVPIYDARADKRQLVGSLGKKCKDYVCAVVPTEGGWVVSVGGTVSVFYINYFAIFYFFLLEQP
jgi:hypothetical protein